MADHLPLVRHLARKDQTGPGFWQTYWSCLHGSAYARGWRHVHRRGKSDRGDANGAADDWQVPAVGTGWVASFHIPGIGYALADLQSTTARLLLLLIPALLLGAITLYEIWRDREREA